MLGRFIEGRYHLNAAVSLSISLGLHRLNIISSPLIGLSVSNIEVPNFALSSVEDMSELHERVLLFWSVLTMDRSWSSALRMPGFLTEGEVPNSEIETPWALTIPNYVCQLLNYYILSILLQFRRLQDLP